MIKTFFVSLFSLLFFISCESTVSSQGAKAESLLIQEDKVTSFSVSAPTLRSSGSEIENIPTNAAVLLNFSEDVNSSSLSLGITLFKLIPTVLTIGGSTNNPNPNSGSGTPTDFTLDYVAIESPETYQDLKHVRVNTQSYFEPETEYLLVVNTEVTNLEGKHLDENVSFEFNTGLHADTSAPQIKSFSPEDGNNVVVIGSSITINFDEFIMPTGTIVLKDGNGGTVATSIEYGSRSITLTPLSDLNYASTYEVSLESDIEDLSGNILVYDSGNIQTVTFDTETTPYTSPSTITYLSTLPLSTTDNKVDTFLVDERDIFYGATTFDILTNTKKVGLNIQQYDYSDSGASSVSLGAMTAFIPFATLNDYNQSQFEESSIVVGNTITSMLRVGDYLCIGTQSKGLYTVNIADKNTSFLISSMDLDDDIIMDMKYDTPTSILYVATAKSGVKEYSLNSSTGVLSYRKTVDTSSAYGIDVYNGRVYIAMGEKGVAYYDVSSSVVVYEESYAFAQDIQHVEDVDYITEIAVADAQAGLTYYDLNLSIESANKTRYYAKNIIELKEGARQVIIAELKKGFSIFDIGVKEMNNKIVLNDPVHQIGLEGRYQEILVDTGSTPYTAYLYFLLNDNNELEIHKQ